MNKKVSLKEIVATKIVYAIILLTYYWMWARTDWKEWYVTVQFLLGCTLAAFFFFQHTRIKKYKKEGVDEMAERNLKRCDSFCLTLNVKKHPALLSDFHTAVCTGALQTAGMLCPDRLRSRMEIDMALITKIKEYREKAGLKQSELADLVGARRETIVHLENGRYNPSLKLAMDIAKVFHVSVEELFEFTDDN